MQKRIKIGLGVLLIVTAGLVALRLLHKRGAVYQGRELGGWTEDYLVGDEDARSRAMEVVYNLRLGDRQRSWAAFTNEVVPEILKALKRRDNRFWRPYTALRRMAPPGVARWLPKWPEPQGVREVAAWELGHLTSSEPKWAVPALCEAAQHDPSGLVRRLAFESVSSIGADCDEAFALMTSTLLGGTNRETRLLAAGWFRSALPCAEKAIPILVKILEDPDPLVSEGAASALAKYGPRARFAAEPIQRITMTQTDHSAFSAFLALAYIDPRAAIQTRSPWTTNEFFAELWRTNRLSSE